MRLFPIVAAIVVVFSLYLLVFERDRLLNFAGTDTAVTEVAGEDTADEAPAADDPGRVKVVAIRSEAQMVDNGVLVRGRTEATRQVEVRAETNGKVISDPLRKGARVEAGQDLCQLDPGTRQDALMEARARLQEARARLPEAEARLAEAQINDNAANRLSAEGFASETRVAATQAVVASARAGVDAADAGVQAALAAVASAEREIARLTIKAPFAGLLETDTAELGSLLQPGGLCATVIQLDPIKLVAFVPETEVARVETGAMAGGRLATGRTVAGAVTFLARSADPSTRTFRVEVDVPNPDLRIRDGQTVEMIISAEGASAHLIPQSSLTLNDEGALGVRTVQEGNIAGFAEVTVIRDSVDGILVSGLPQSVDIITVGQEYVTDGVPVAPTYRERAE
ncbi:MAG: efflux RND transporter periplasmic adaptor subunit [Rhodobacteraceae bacterium]|nr:efflux RND transporter periplasmic adaptor subunit [Paracoccaceae bacterium]